MRILVLGAGGTGGYFGARLVQSGADVQFLVRPRRAETLRANGLLLRTADTVERIEVRAVTGIGAGERYDLILLSCKAYDLTAAMDAIAPAMVGDTLVLPLLNGLAHFDKLDQRFGADHVLGGLCHLSAMLGESGEIQLLGPMHSITFGERDGRANRARCDAIAGLLRKASFDSVLSVRIQQDLWNKFAFLAAAAALTCLLRANVGAIMATGHGPTLALQMIEECEQIAASSGFPVSAGAAAMARRLLTARESTFTASMLRDIGNGGPIEADHIVGDLLRRGAVTGCSTPLLEVAYSALQAYEQMRSRVPSSRNA